MPVHPSNTPQKDPVDEWAESRTSAVRVRPSVPSPSRAWSVLASLLAAVLVTVLTCGAFLLASPVHAFAADSDSSSETSGENTTITSNITDTQNLLGSDIGKVTDAIDEVKTQTGVTLNLLYLPAFDSSQKTETWASALLESTKPKKNTVMLAVASEEGSLVVVVSKNSDSWLRNETTVDSLSEAALTPIVSGTTPNWSGSAIMLAHKIESVKSENDAAPVRQVSIIVLIVVLVVLVAVAGFFLVRHLHRRGKRRRHAAKKDPTSRLHLLGQKHDEKSEDEGDEEKGDAQENDTLQP
ncbi:MAG: TPM domain-containing protein [Bifidobacteriaceae bacterium]|nr:TPM domain-containing protein [Bifidobacteriaceae bacterium]MCI1978828.1 TPM domain-containing protein [Bifidobacteriaceae bacterium]